MTELGEGLFTKCENLLSVTLPANLTSLPDSTFNHCRLLADVTMPRNLKVIGVSAFLGCQDLCRLSIPASVTEIRDDAFNHCAGLSVYYEGTPAQWRKITIGVRNYLESIYPVYYSKPVAGFSDVKESQHFADTVAWAIESDIANGTSSDIFSPYMTVDRAQAVTFLWRTAGCPEPSSTVSPYRDVTNANAYYYKAVLWATEQGIVGGVGNHLFNLSGQLSYDQMLTTPGRAAGANLTGSNWSAAAVEWAETRGLTKGLSYSAGGSCPRCDVAYLLWMQMK